MLQVLTCEIVIGICETEKKAVALSAQSAKNAAIPHSVGNTIREEVPQNGFK